ncbi:MAG: class I SAM-dependent methyltransferase [Myxococcales bacterium]
MSAMDQRATLRVLERGPRGRPLMLLRDVIKASGLRWRSSWRRRRHTELASASSVKACLTAGERVLPLNQIESEISGFLEWARRLAPKRICEIGVEGGGTHLALKFALGTVELAIGVDLYVLNKEALAYFSRPAQREVLIDGSSYAPPTVARVEQTLSGELLDLLFIDGDHSFDGAAQDFERYRRLVRKGGIIAFHDVVEDSATRTGYHTGTYTGGVPALWRQLRGQYPGLKEFVSSWEQDGYGIGAIVYDPEVVPALSKVAAEPARERALLTESASDEAVPLAGTAPGAFQFRR